MPRRRWLIGLIGPLCVVVALIAGLSWLVASNAGLRWTLALAERYAPVSIHYKALSGRLIGPIEVTALRVRSDAVTVRLARGELRWRPMALLGGQLHILELGLERVDIETPRQPSEALAKPSVSRLDWPGQWLPPIRIRIDRASLADLQLRRPGAVAIRIERLAFGMEMGPSGARVEDFELASPLGQASGSLRLAAESPYGLSGDLEWRVRPLAPRTAAMAGRLELGGDLRQPRIRLHWREPSAASLAWRVRPFQQSVPWQAELALPPTRLRQWWSGAPGLSAGTQVRLEGTTEQVSITGDLGVSGLPVGRIAARFQGVADADGLAIERLELRSEEHPAASAQLAGDVAWDSGVPVVDVHGRWRDLAWPLVGEPTLRSRSGRVQVTGPLADYRLAGDGVLQVPGTRYGTAQLEWSGAGSLTALERFEVRARWQQATLRATGAAAWTDLVRARTRLEVERFDPSDWVRGPDGSLAGALELEVSETPAGWRGQAELAALRGLVSGRPVSGGGRVRFDGASWSVDRVAVRAGDAELTAKGTVGRRAAFEWRVRVPELAQLLPGYSGRIDGQGSVTGAAERPTVRLDLAAEALESPSWRVDALRIRGGIDISGTTRSDVRLVATGLQAQQRSLASLDAKLEGVPGDHRLKATLRHDYGEAVLHATGSLEGSDWTGELVAGTLIPVERAPWRLASAQPLRWVGERFEAGEGCWVSNQATACLQGWAAATGFSATLAASDVPVSLAGNYWRPELEYTGTFGLNAKVGSDGQAITGEARLHTSPGRIEGAIEGEPETLFAYGAGEGRLQLEATELLARLDWSLPEQGRLAGELRVGRASPHALSGRITASTGQLGLIPVLVPSIGSVKGHLFAELGLSGSAAEPGITGDLRLEEGAVTVVPAGIRLTQLEAALASAGDGVDLRLRASSGPGRAQLLAQATRGDDGRWRATGSITGADFLAADLAEISVTVSPYLQWRSEGRDVTVRGSIRVPTARITPRDLAGTVQPSSDAVVVRRKDEAVPSGGGAPGWSVTADIAVVPGDDVHIDAFGLEGRLAGSLRLIERPGQVTTALGELKVVDGTYTIYRQTLAIERGRVIYSGGPVGNPGLDVRAVRRPRNVLVGVNVRGTLREPRAELFSEPPMTESQQLSYLILGVPLGETSSSEAETLAAAAAFLAKSEQASALARRLGIDEVEVEAGGAGEGTSIVLGRYLSPRLYIGYGIGLLEEANSVRMRYELSDLWSLEAQSGTTSSADIIYTIEVDNSMDAVPSEVPGLVSEPPQEESE